MAHPPSKWQIVGAGIAAATLGAAGMVAVGGDDGEPAEADTIELRDQTSTASVDSPTAVDAHAEDQVSADGESLDSPLQSADDSPEGADSVDTPGDSPRHASAASADSPDAAPAPRAAPAPAPASVDSPDPAPAPAPASVDSPSSVDSSASVDSP
jgi:hypothetical protein